MIEKSLAAIVLAVCVVLMARLLLGSQRRYAFDAFVRRSTRIIQGKARAIYHWRSSRKDAARVAEEAIRRAREGGTWEGNVYKPKSFKRPPRDKLH